MKRFFAATIFVLLQFCSAGYSSAQTSQYSHFVVWLKDKNNNPFSLSNPALFLSQKAIARRNAQSISYDEKDLPITPSYIDSIVSTGVHIHCKSKWLNCVVIQTGDSLALQKIASFPFVLSDSQPAKSTLNGSDNFSLRKFHKDEPITQDYGNSFLQNNMIEADELHRLGFDGQGKVIAVLDNGFLNADVLNVFDSLRFNNQILGTWNFVTENDTVFREGDHGSMVLSCIAGNFPATLLGTAPRVSVWLLKTEDNQSESPLEEFNWAAGAEFADSVGADIITSSLGYSEFDSARASLNHSYSQMDGNTCPSTIAADVAAARGMLVCVAAGNEGKSSWHFLTAPSDGDSVLCVGGVDASRFHSDFASYGPSADGDVKPNVSAMARGDWISQPGTNGFMNGSGTSFATPIIAGAAASLWSAFPNATAWEIKTVIERSASQFADPDDSTGYGIPDFRMAYLMMGDDPKFRLTDDLLFYPNPTHSNLTIQMVSDSEQTVSWFWWNEIGQKISGGKELIGSSLQFVNIETPEATGIYYLIAELNGERWLMPVAVQ